MEFSRGGGNVWRGVHWQFKSGRSQKFVFNDAFSHFMLPSLRKREKNIYREEVRNNHGILVFLRYFWGEWWSVGPPIFGQELRIQRCEIIINALMALWVRKPRAGENGTRGGGINNRNIIKVKQLIWGVAIYIHVCEVAKGKPLRFSAPLCSSATPPPAATPPPLSEWLIHLKWLSGWLTYRVNREH